MTGGRSRRTRGRAHRPQVAPTVEKQMPWPSLPGQDIRRMSCHGWPRRVAASDQSAVQV